MELLVRISQFVLSLSILIVLHECGHFFPAKWFKTKVEKFYLFFDPWFSLWKTQKGETEYGIGWLPLGGYVKIAGMIDESFDKEQMAGPPQPWEFRSKPAWQRLIIMLGGVTVNFILGIVLFAYVLFHWGENYISNDTVTMGIAVDSLGYDMGLRDGDLITDIAGKPLERFNSSKLITEIVINNARELTVNREGRKIKIPIDSKFTRLLSKQSDERSKLYDFRLPFTIAEIGEDSQAEKVGLKIEDQVIGVNGESLPYYHQLKKVFDSNPSKTINLTVLRNETDTLYKDITLSDQGRLGVNRYLADHWYGLQKKKYGALAAVPAGYNKAVDFLSSQVKAFGQMFRGNIKVKDSLGSFISIGKLYDTTWNWERFWNMTAMLSVLLGFINLLPIPALDGGHVMFLLWEVITGRKPSDKFLEYATLGGFVLLMGLMIYALGLDISRLFK